MNKIPAPHVQEHLVQISLGSVKLEGNLVIPVPTQGIVLFAHGSGSSRYSPRNRYVAEVLNQEGLATLLLDLLTDEEEEIDRQTQQLRFDLDLLSSRVLGATEWLSHNPATCDLNMGYFGASTGSAAALIAAAKYPDIVKAIVSRGGRPDLASFALPHVQAPTLLLVGGSDSSILHMNEDALAQLHQVRHKRLEIIPGATHLFEERGALEQVAALAAQWFKHYLLSEQYSGSEF